VSDQRRPSGARTAERRITITVVVLAALLAGCGRGFEAGGLGAVPDAETPRPSAGAAAQGTLAALRDALAVGGFAIAPARREFQPAQPAALLQVPRSAYQVGLADPDGGVVILYEFPTSEAAGAGAQALADYLSSGPGKINFAGDTAFHVAHLGPTAILAWFSESQSTDPQAAKGAFDLVSTVGAEVPVLR
jgi:hypothetical protein